MESIKLEVTGNIAKVTQKPQRITAGTVGMPVEFTFDEHWEDLDRIAVFQAGRVRKNMALVEDKTAVPMEVLATPGPRLNIGVYGVNKDGSIAIPTIWANAGQIREGATPGDGAGSDIGIAKKYYDQAMLAAADADQAAETAVSAADRAEDAAKEAKEAVSVSEKVYYSTTREEVGKAHTDTDWADYIYGLYRVLPGVVEKDVKSDDGTVITHEFVISTGEYSTEGAFAQQLGADSDIKKPKYLISSGVHGSERNAAISVYRFIRDVLSGHNVSQAFKEGAILHVLPVGNPYGFDEFLRENEDGVDINHDFTNATKAKETQAIINWLTENKDTDLYIDAHNSGYLNEIVAILGDSDHDFVNTAKKIALKGVDRVIPFWRNVIGYPTEMEVIVDYTQYIETGKISKEDLGKKPVIFASCADYPVGDTTFAYASNVLSIPSLSLEMSTYYGDYSDYNPTLEIPPTTETYPAETIAAGAEVIGNILIEFYTQACEVMEMSNIGEKIGDTDASLNSILDMQNYLMSGFKNLHLERGNSWSYADVDVIVDGETVVNHYVSIHCSPNPKLIIFKADDATATAASAAALANSKTYAAAAILQNIQDLDTISVAATNEKNSMMLSYQSYYGMVVPDGEATALEDVATVPKFKVHAFLTEYADASGTTVPAVYNWTAYYWDE